LDDMPVAVPEVFVDYLRRLKPNPARSDRAVSDDVFIRAAQALASVSLGANLVPQDFSPDTAAEALTADVAGTQQRDLIERLIDSGVVERRTPGGYEVLR